MSGGWKARPDCDASCSNHDGCGEHSGEPQSEDITSAAQNSGEPHVINPDPNNYHDDGTCAPEKHDLNKARIVASHDVDQQNHFHTKCPRPEVIVCK